MGGKSKAPAPPNYKEVAAASKEAAQLSYKLGKEQLDWAKEQYALDSSVTGKIIDSFLTDQEDNSEAARADRARYEEIFQPLEGDLAEEARSYSSPERRDLEVGRAQSNVAQQFSQARESAKTELESYGINPSATRYAALDMGMRANEAAAKAAAGNQASQMVDATGRALRSEAINVGRGYPGQIAGTYNTALAAGSGAGGMTLNQTQSGANTMGTNAQYMGLGNQAVGTWGNTLNMGYQNQLSAWEANQKASSGWGSALGLVGGLAFGFDDGGAVPTEGAIPMPAGQGPGGAVPAGASPTQGRAIDDVPARLTPGEFVVPKDIVSWKGEEFFQKLIQKSREAKTDEGNARPDVRAAIPTEPTYQSRAIH